MTSPAPLVAPSLLTAAAETRSVEILARIRTVFAEKGFDGASMQDLARAAGMSVGNFYRYFPSKAAIVEAMVGFDMAEIERDFAAIASAGDPLGAMRDKIAERVTQGCEADGRLWSEITAAAHRKAEIAQICCAMEELVAENLLALFARVSGRPLAEVQARHAAQARFVVLMIKAAGTRTGPPDSALDALILRAIDSALTDVVTSPSSVSSAAAKA